MDSAHSFRDPGSQVPHLVAVHLEPETQSLLMAEERVRVAQASC